MTHSALITGGLGGLGLALSELLANKGWQVFAADCNETSLEALPANSEITPVFMNVTDSDSVRDAFNEIRSKVNRLDAIINFAGILRVGAMIEIDEEILHKVLDVNLLGTYRVNKAFFPLLSKPGTEGRIVNISSETGWHTASPFNGPYAISKYGIEAYSDALRRELSVYNIPVICVQPGPFKTSLVSDSVDGFNDAAQASKLYPNQLKHFGQLVSEANQTSHAPEQLAQVIYKALTSSRPKHRYSVKPDAGRSLLEWIPMRVADGIFRRLLSKA